jgi:hypothetical protein
MMQTKRYLKHCVLKGKIRCSKSIKQGYHTLTIRDADQLEKVKGSMDEILLSFPYSHRLTEP